ncbi:MAG TPA: hypothetical protein PKN48_00475 [Bacteroidales bacterium]|nr:hypothetical protein [Bacteroidales bacterium]
MSKKKEDNTNEVLLLQLFEDGFATTEVDLIPGKVQAVIRNLGSQDQIQIEKEMESITGGTPVIIHTYGLKLLGATLIQYGTNVFADRNAAVAFLDKANLSSALIDKLVKSQNLLEKRVRNALNMDEIDKVFFAPGSPLEEQKPSLKDMTSASEEV